MNKLIEERQATRPRPGGLAVRVLGVLICAPLALAACDGDRSDDRAAGSARAPSGEATAPLPVESASTTSSEALVTGPKGTAYPLPQIPPDDSGRTAQAAPAPAAGAQTQKADAPKSAATPSRSSSADSATAAAPPAGSAGQADAAEESGASAAGDKLTKEEEKNQMPLPGQVHNYSSDARKAGQNDATPTGEPGGAAQMPGPGGKGESAAAGGATAGEAAVAGQDTPANAPDSDELTSEEEKNQMPMPGQVHNYSGDARKAGQSEATPTDAEDASSGNGQAGR